MFRAEKRASMKPSFCPRLFPKNTKFIIQTLDGAGNKSRFHGVSIENY